MTTNRHDVWVWVDNRDLGDGVELCLMFYVKRKGELWWDEHARDIRDAVTAYPIAHYRWLLLGDAAELG
jgi:hypothetical protein